MQRIERIMIAVLLIALAWVWNANAGTEPGGPTTAPAATNSYTIEDIYNRLNAGTAGAQSPFTEPSAAAGTGTMHTLNDVMSVAPAKDDTNGATAADVASGKTFWGLNVTSNEWGLKTGTAAPVGLPKTGQTTSHATGDDGDLQKGVTLPTPRFTNNGDGTVTDNLTGLIWLKKANCTDAIGGVTFNSAALSWQEGLDFAAALANGSCGLTDSSSAGDWRLSNVRELQSLIDYGQNSPALPTVHPFTNVQSFFYWSSSTYSNDTTNGWKVNLNDGNVNNDNKTNNHYVWPVRGGE